MIFYHISAHFSIHKASILHVFSICLILILLNPKTVIYFLYSLTPTIKCPAATPGTLFLSQVGRNNLLTYLYSVVISVPSYISLISCSITIPDLNCIISRSFEITFIWLISIRTRPSSYSTSWQEVWFRNRSISLPRCS